MGYWAIKWDGGWAVCQAIDEEQARTLAVWLDQPQAKIVQATEADIVRLKMGGVLIPNLISH
jgi:hypothetical protein